MPKPQNTQTSKGWEGSLLCLSARCSPVAKWRLSSVISFWWSLFLKCKFAVVESELFAVLAAGKDSQEKHCKIHPCTLHLCSNSCSSGHKPSRSPQSHNNTPHSSSPRTAQLTQAEPRQTHLCQRLPRSHQRMPLILTLFPSTLNLHHTAPDFTAQPWEPRGTIFFFCCFFKGVLLVLLV